MISVVRGEQLKVKLVRQAETRSRKALHVLLIGSELYPEVAMNSFKMEIISRWTHSYPKPPVRDITLMSWDVGGWNRLLQWLREQTTKTDNGSSRSGEKQSRNTFFKK